MEWSVVVFLMFLHFRVACLKDPDYNEVRLIVVKNLHYFQNWHPR